MTPHIEDVDSLIEWHRDEWVASTSGVEFIAGARNGSLDPAAFERWLVQDRHFIDGLYTAQLRVAALATGELRRTHLHGIVALQDELDWLAERARSRGLDLDAPLVETCRAFVEYLQTLAFAPPAVAHTAIWTVERAYLDAWGAALPGAEAYREFVEHWSDPAFQYYVGELRAGANEALARASDGDHIEAERAFRRVMTFERRFWRMAEGYEE
jgi:formylaminopyrimidine deformylase / aminopyrimidine aminohydrolase